MARSEIQLERIAPPFQFKAVNSEGHSLIIDAGVAAGGKGDGVRPMELLLMGLAGCSGIDVVHILNKQKQHIDAMSVTVQGERGDSQGANPFEKIHLIFELKGTIEAAHLERAIALSLEKYCSAAKMLEKTAHITSEYKINP